jgi:chromosome segregation ATPase
VQTKLQIELLDTEEVLRE